MGPSSEPADILKDHDEETPEWIADDPEYITSNRRQKKAFDQQRIEALEQENAELKFKISQLSLQIENDSKRQNLESLATFTGGIAHHFNNIIFGITGNIELIKMNWDDPRMSKYLARISEAAARMADLNARLTAYARCGKYRPKMLVLSKFIKTSLDQMPHNFGPDIMIKTMLHNDVGIIADIFQMNLVFSALLSNAAEAIEKTGEIFIETGKIPPDSENQYWPHLKFPGTYAYYSVRDTGVGMDKSTLEHIFEPFFSTKMHGRGLDMAAVYGIVRNHDGWIHVESEKGKGTTVKVILPAASIEHEH